MTSGVMRPYTFPDILAALTGQNSGSNADTTISGLGYIGEADEPSISSDTATGIAVLPQDWDQAQWSCFSWA